MNRSNLRNDHGKWDWNPIKFYSLVQKLCLPDLQNRVMDLLVHHNQKYNAPGFATPSVIAAIYTRTTEGCGLRIYVSMMCAAMILDQEGFRLDGKDTMGEYNDVIYKHFDLNTDVMGHLLGSKGNIGFHEAEVCEFHEHAVGAACYDKYTTYDY